MECTIDVFATTYFIFFRTGRILSIRFQFDSETCSFQWNWMIGVLLGQYSKKNLSFDEE